MAISLEKLKLSMLVMSLEITNLRLQPHLSGVNVLMLNFPFIQWLYTWMINTVKLCSSTVIDAGCFNVETICYTFHCHTVCDIKEIHKSVWLGSLIVPLFLRYSTAITCHVLQLTYRAQSSNDLEWLDFKSSTPGGFDYNIKFVNFKLISIIKIWSIFCEIVIRWMTQHLTNH